MNRTFCCSSDAVRCSGDTVRCGDDTVWCGGDAVRCVNDAVLLRRFHVISFHIAIAVFAVCCHCGAIRIRNIAAASSDAP